MKNLVLIGMMGCGKSTCGRLLAQSLQWEWVDIDAQVERRAGKPIPDIFDQDGEEAFRALEEEESRALAQRAGLVVSCGGGLPLRSRAMAPLAQSGTVVFLERDPEDILDHVSMDRRPLGQGSRADFLARYRQREPVYRRWADLTVPSQPSPQSTVGLILQKLNWEGVS